MGSAVLFMGNQLDGSLDFVLLTNSGHRATVLTQKSGLILEDLVADAIVVLSDSND